LKIKDESTRVIKINRNVSHFLGDRILKFLLVGTVRDSFMNVEREYRHISGILNSLGNVRTFLVESDSIDGTVKVLEEMSRRYNDFDFLSLGKMDEEIPNRYERIAFCREKYLDYFKENSIDYDFVVVADFDGMNHDLTLSKVEASLSQMNDWDALFANQGDRYYDIGALRHEFWSPNNCFETYEWAVRNMNVSDARDLSINSRMIRINPAAPIIKVESAYGGFGVYKSLAFAQGTYIGRDSRNEPLLDFVCFNTILSGKGFRLGIDPQLINAKFNYHNIGTKKWVRLIRRIGTRIVSPRLKGILKYFLAKVAFR
jgi:hypothetical protein